ncbi:expressed unknown protein [Seminavis robusta]|uniref:Uncharacterized protein n=1 Tax=Seminavis robusta TaxID=568900 RepID=A0A9N8HRA1_9STRA|nr:expressed unknown protein [Seminavis robusta]|eukprot:Sro1372_g267150.1 n/a (386) ;mRNA; r:8219-9376
MALANSCVSPGSLSSSSDVEVVDGMSSSTKLQPRSGGGFLKSAFPLKDDQDDKLQPKDDNEKSFSVGLSLDDEEDEEDRSIHTISTASPSASGSTLVCNSCMDESASSAYSDADSVASSCLQDSSANSNNKPARSPRRKRRMRLSKSLTALSSSLTSSSKSPHQHVLLMTAPAVYPTMVATKSALRKSSSYGCLQPCCQVIPIATKSKAWKQLPAPRHVPKFDREVHEELLQQHHPTNQVEQEPFSSLFAARSVRASMVKHLKRVSFSDVNIREHALTLGDNPSCHLGAPVSLDWSYNQHSAMSVDYYEYQRNRRAYRDLRLPPVHRQELLLQFDISPEEMRRANVEKEKVQRQREITRSFLVPTAMELVVESAIRKMKRSLSVR